MHVQIVSFGVNGTTEEACRLACQAETGTVAGLPGLLWKVRLRSPDADVHGWLCLRRDRGSSERYVRDEGRPFQDDPALQDVLSQSFAVFEDLNAATQQIDVDGASIVDPTEV